MNLGYYYNYFDVAIAVTAFMAMALPPDSGPIVLDPKDLGGWSINRRSFIRLALYFILSHLLLKFTY